MKNLVVYGGKYGATKKCAELIQEKLVNTVIVDVKEVNGVNLGDYENIIVGSHIIAGSLNKKLVKFLTDNKQILANKRVFGYIVAASSENETQYIENLGVYTGSKVLYVGGILDPLKARGLFKLIIKAVIKDMTKKGLPLPSIDENKINKLVELVNYK